VALGGGHGLAASLGALRHVTSHLTAIVTVADDGGSSGRLREDFDVLPPGDLRMALTALTDDSDWGRTWRDVLQHRFPAGGDLGGHAVGNLLIVALWQILGDNVDGLDWVARLLRATGRVLPMSPVPLAVEADITRQMDGREWSTTVRGQARVATAGGRVDAIRLIPPNPPACREAVEAIEAADWVVLGPGSWYTSVIPHLMIPELAEAVAGASHRRCLTLNLSAQSGETSGYTAADHLAALSAYAPGIHFDVVIADPSGDDDGQRLAKAVEAMGGRLLARHVRVSDGSARHDALRLAAAYRDAFEAFGESVLSASARLGRPGEEHGA
jgi:uncharacterized cofD-like protein